MPSSLESDVLSGGARLDLEQPASVAEQIDALLGERLLPVRSRRPGVDEPHLLAVDASGQPVVVEVVGLLDEAACLRALRYAGRAARLGTQDLVALYRGGPDRFAEHLEAFRLTVPASTLLQTSVRGGARLLVVCAQIAPAVTDLLEFLLQPGWQVEVLRVEVTPGVQGRRLVGVTPVTRTPPARRGLEPAPLRVVPTRGLGSAVDATPAASATAVGFEPAAGHATAVGHATATSPVTTVGHATATAGHPTAAGAGSLRDELFGSPSRPTPRIVPPSFAVRSAEVSQAAAPVRRSVGVVAPPPPPVPVTVGPGPALAAVAARLGEPTVLVWRSTSAVHEALLHPDGALELPDGSIHRDPDVAAQVASGEVVDGWTSWRVGGDGPSLAELRQDAVRPSRTP